MWRVFTLLLFSLACSAPVQQTPSLPIAEATWKQEGISLPALAAYQRDHNQSHLSVSTDQGTLSLSWNHWVTSSIAASTANWQSGDSAITPVEATVTTNYTDLNELNGSVTFELATKAVTIDFVITNLLRAYPPLLQVWEAIAVCGDHSTMELGLGTSWTEQANCHCAPENNRATFRWEQLSGDERIGQIRMVYLTNERCASPGATLAPITASFIAYSRDEMELDGISWQASGSVAAAR